MLFRLAAGFSVGVCVGFRELHWRLACRLCLFSQLSLLGARFRDGFLFVLFVRCVQSAFLLSNTVFGGFSFFLRSSARTIKNLGFCGLRRSRGLRLSAFVTGKQENKWFYICLRAFFTRGKTPRNAFEAFKAFNILFRSLGFRFGFRFLQRQRWCSEFKR